MVIETGNVRELLDMQPAIFCNKEAVIFSVSISLAAQLVLLVISCMKSAGMITMI